MNTGKVRRQFRTRNKVKASGRVRVSVYRSNKYISAQLIDDTKHVTLVGVSDKELKTKGTKTEKAKALGLLLAEKAKAKKVTKVVFDRGSYAYHGRVKSVAEGLREGGMEF
jgi:large subunit ribosomal protein L18